MKTRHPRQGFIVLSSIAVLHEKFSNWGWGAGFSKTQNPNLFGWGGVGFAPNFLSWVQKFGGGGGWWCLKSWNVLGPNTSEMFWSGKNITETRAVLLCVLPSSNPTVVDGASLYAEWGSLYGAPCTVGTTIWSSPLWCPTVWCWGGSLYGAPVYAVEWCSPTVWWRAYMVPHPIERPFPSPGCGREFFLSWSECDNPDRGLSRKRWSE